MNPTGLNARLARALGWELLDPPPGGYSRPCWVPPGAMWPVTLPDWAGTWEGLGMVVAEMERAKWTLLLTNLGGQWTAQFNHPEEVGMSKHGDTAPLAVARAALGALEEAEAARRTLGREQGERK